MKSSFFSCTHKNKSTKSDCVTGFRSRFTFASKCTLLVIKGITISVGTGLFENLRILERRAMTGTTPLTPATIPVCIKCQTCTLTCNDGAIFAKNFHRLIRTNMIYISKAGRRVAIVYAARPRLICPWFRSHGLLNIKPVNQTYVVIIQLHIPIKRHLE